VTSLARGNPSRRRTLGLTVGASVVLLAASVVGGSTAAGAGHGTSPRPATDVITQQGTLTIARGSEDGANGTGTITVTPPGVVCPPTCSFQYNEGDSPTLTGNPSSGSFFHHWDHVQGTSTCAASNFEAICTVRLTGTSTDINAIFLPDPTLAVGVTGNIDVNGTPAAVTVSPGGVCESSQNGGDACYFGVAPGSAVTLTPINTTAATLVSWSVPECPGTGACTIVVDSQLRSVVATFSPMKLSLKIDPNSVTGTVTGSLNCSADCDGDFPAFTEVTLTASSPGFLGWNGACLEAGTSQTCTIRLSGDDVVGAWFQGSPSPPTIIPPRIPVPLQVKKTGDGAGTVTSARSRFSETINCGSGPGCDAYFEQGETARLVAEPAVGSAFAGWRTPGGLCSSAVNCRFDVMRVSRLEANFVKRAQQQPPPPQPQPQPPQPQPQPPPPQPRPQPPGPPGHCAVRKVGGPRADLLDGGARSDAIHGRGGNDRIRGRGGNDCLFGEGGNDEARGGRGNDTVSGGTGSDRLYGEAGRDTMRGGPGRDRIFAVDRARDVITCGGGRDTVRADRVDRILGCEAIGGPPP
jgi:RTX calcium-binding nonapeptide repeat (4 copies)/Divergent InlB B-repeat domain